MEEVFKVLQLGYNTKMKKIHYLIGLGLLVIVGLFLYFCSSKVFAPSPETAKENMASSPENATYNVEGEEFTLVAGSAKKELMPNSATMSELVMFGEPSFGDIDGDGDDDAVLILVNNPGGSGSFYYATLAINIAGKYKGTDAVLLGDRIAPQTYRIIDNKAEINYVVRRPEDDFSIAPSVGKSLFLKYDPETFRLIEIASDFEGEANPAVMKLDMQPWTWIKTIYSDKTEVEPHKSGVFKLTFKDDGIVSASTDCNSIGGVYKVEGNKIIIGELAMTEMFCADSQEQDFLSVLNNLESYDFTGKGELIFNLKSGQGTAVFR